MAREVITITSEAQWLDLRREDITSTMVPALFGLSPYTTRFELYHAKASGIEVPFKSNDRVEKGKRMEAAIAHEAALQEGWTNLKPLDDYIRIPGRRAGSSFDFECMDADGNPLLVEVKMVDFFRHRDLWVDDQAPEHIEIQGQWQLEVADRFPRVAIVAWAGTYDCNVYYRDRDRDMGAAMMTATDAFWADVDAGREPEPDFARDEDVIARMNRQLREQPADMTADQDFDLLLARYEREKQQASEFDALAKATKAEIHYRLADAPAAFTARYKITAGWTKDTPPRPAEPGYMIPGRAGYRQCLVKNLMEGKKK